MELIKRIFLNATNNDRTAELTKGKKYHYMGQYTPCGGANLIIKYLHVNI